MSTYKATQKFASILKEKKYKFMAREFLMGHRYHSWAWALPGALDYVLNDSKNCGPLPGRTLKLAESDNE